MAAMGRFDHILNWTLKRGSHMFPSQDGGTCINEAAIVAAGFPYRPVRTVDDMPGCFSRPICRLAMQLNDEASDEERQMPLPFVTRLACADTAKVEREREAYINSLMSYRLSFRDRLDALEGAYHWVAGCLAPIGRSEDPVGRRASECEHAYVGC
jgi:hypothetical protein